MKIALYIEDSLEQIVLTPESDTERSILSKLQDGTRQLKVYRGEFYPCRGGWSRWRREYTNYGGSFSPDFREDDSTIIVLRPPEPTKEHDTTEVSDEAP